MRTLFDDTWILNTGLNEYHIWTSLMVSQRNFPSRSRHGRKRLNFSQTLPMLTQVRIFMVLSKHTFWS